MTYTLGTFVFFLVAPGYFIYEKSEVTFYINSKSTIQVKSEVLSIARMYTHRYIITMDLIASIWFRFSQFDSCSSDIFAGRSFKGLMCFIPSSHR